MKRLAAGIFSGLSAVFGSRSRLYDPEYMEIFRQHRAKSKCSSCRFFKYRILCDNDRDAEQYAAGNPLATTFKATTTINCAMWLKS